MSDIKPIETRYAGCHFRSRLEARWAVFFDALEIRWEYEPEGFDLEAGPYLPDFRLRGLGGDGLGKAYVWFEVKPDDDIPDDPRWDQLSHDAPVLVAFGMPPANRTIDDCPRQNGWIELWDQGGWDGCRYFCTCPICGSIGIAFSGLGNRVCAHGDDREDRYSSGDPRILDAYRAARSARFEHGQRGAT